MGTGEGASEGIGWVTGDGGPTWLRVAYVLSSVLSSADPGRLAVFA
jgi:hypothetical protein